MSERLTDVDAAWHQFNGLTHFDVKALLDHPAMMKRAFSFGFNAGLAARESVSLPNERQLRVLAERAYPGLAPSGFCSGHAVEHPYDCTVCYPDLPALIQEHIRVREARVAELDEARQKRVNHLDDCIVAEARVASLEAALRELLSQHEAGYTLPPASSCLGQGDVRSEAWEMARAALDASPSHSPS